MYETAPSKTIWFFLGYLMHVYTILNIKVAYFFLFFNATGYHKHCIRDIIIQKLYKCSENHTSITRGSLVTGSSIGRKL